jgi:hypothetical protein
LWFTHQNCGIASTLTAPQEEAYAGVFAGPDAGRPILDKFELLESFCASQLEDIQASAAVTTNWKEQSQLLWPEAQRFAGWQDVAYDASDEALADQAIANRARDGGWPRLSPSTGRIIASRLTQALAIIQVNELASDRPGIPLPSGLSVSAQTSALLIYWCYAMELPLAETGGTTVGLA